jgi:hypothetical protein
MPVTYLNLLISLECFSHILHRVGENTGDDRDMAETLRKKYVDFFKNSHKRVSEWREFSGVSIPTHNRIRWASDHLLETFLLHHFEQFRRYLEQSGLESLYYYSIILVSFICFLFCLNILCLCLTW